LAVEGGDPGLEQPVVDCLYLVGNSQRRHDCQQFQFEKKILEQGVKVLPNQVRYIFVRWLVAGALISLVRIQGQRPVALVALLCPL
jgi:hypothetical protein